MKFTLEISMKNTEGVLERILARMRQRNLNIQAINANCTADSQNIEAKFTVESKMTAEPIMKQLAKLYDVQKINVFYLDTKSDLTSKSDQLYYPSPKVDNALANLGERNEICLAI